ncbi:putative HNH endonuclease domain protein [Microbacterium esteraromaticum]|uniref:Putative HNH endonuclease domain protein n=1 Tax=Microbacterium esteraromaticum TaxID=57043 RepID=A0A1R4JUF9_9MICO|nr:HNH endonuclease signature motif containing protein [Microbacterium esteraromaticum]SJN35455.1 putative HNH endonuclease domain protein [Microbacterium esteraromaticum]
MNSVVDRLEYLQAEFAAVLGEAFACEEIADLPDDEVMRLLDVTGGVQRTIDAAQVEATAQVRERSEGLRAERLTSTYGCSTPADLLAMVLRIDRSRARRLVKAAGCGARTRGITDGAFLPARFEQLRLALNEGAIGIDGFLAATGPLENSRGRIAHETRVEADRQLAAFARGDHGEADAEAGARVAPAPTPDELAQLSHVLVAYLDPDGAEPSDGAASHERGLWMGAVRHGRVPLRGELLPEVAAQLNRLLDSLLNPRVGPVATPDGVHFVDSADAQGEESLAPIDDRTRPQKMHDTFATILMAAARGGELPDLGGAAPTLLVTVSASDYAVGSGWAHVDGADAPVPMRVAAQVGCAGGIQRVLFDDRGRIVGLGISARIFNSLQRRAIIARDGGCIVPGCTIPATWCEIHHVEDHARGGPTHTDNGVALCWHHHRTLHLSAWQVRMRHGTPEIRGPGWWDRERRWRPTGRRAPLRSSRAARYG